MADVAGQHGAVRMYGLEQASLAMPALNQETVTQSLGRRGEACLGKPSCPAKLAFADLAKP